MPATRSGSATLASRSRTALASNRPESAQPTRPSTGVSRLLLAIMAHDPASIPRGTYLLWCAHNLERMGDRVTNIAERVIFMMTGTMKELNN